MRESEPSFGEQLRRLRRGASLSQEELAERAGLTPAAVGALERGDRRHPYPHTVHLLADALGLSAADRAAFFAAVPRRGPRVDTGAGSAEPFEAARWPLPPLPLTPLVGRQQDITLVIGLLQRERARLVTLTGPGGVGKTRLAIEIAGSLRSSFVDGPVWVDLAPVRNPELVLPSVARALGLVESAGTDIAETLVSWLGDRHLLLLLDNFEHLLPAAPAVAALLERCSRLSVLVTSREALHVRGEQEAPVIPLRLPDLENVAGAESVVHAEAVDLFLQRAGAVRPGFELTDADAKPIAAICSRLDGVPLALELAAVQMKYMSPTVLLDRLKSRLDLLESGPRDLPERQRSLRATIAWSYELLTAPEQGLLRRLAIFAGGFTQEAAQRVCSAETASPEQGYRALAALVDKNVVRALPDSTGEIRFAMLETIREYARERLVGNGEEPGLANRHAGYFCDLAEAAAPHLSSASRNVWLEQLDVEVANLRAALAWAVAGGDLHIGLRLAGALGWFWVMRGCISEGTRWAELLLSLSEASEGEDGARAYLLYIAAMLAWKREDYTLARRYAEASVAGLRPLGNSRRFALSLAGAGLVAASQGDFDRASRYHEECLSLFRELADHWGMAYALANRADVALHQGDLSEAERIYTQSLEEFEQVGDRWGRGIVLHTLGNVAWARGNVALARTRYRESVALLRGIKDDDAARCLIGLAAATLIEGQADEAEELLMESIALWRNFGSSSGMAICLAGLASVQACRGRFDKAVRLFAAAGEQGRGRPAPYLVDADIFSGYLETSRQHLDETSFARLLAEGKDMPLEQAIDYAHRP